MDLGINVMFAGGFHVSEEYIAPPLWQLSSGSARFPLTRGSGEPLPVHQITQAERTSAGRHPGAPG